MARTAPAPAPAPAPVTAATQHPFIGRGANYPIGSLVVTVTVLDVRMRFGSPDVLIAPLSGAGSQWVALSSVAIDDEPRT